jgi:hypothetical protein
MHIFCILFVLARLAFPTPTQDQAAMLNKAANQITEALNLFTQAGEPIRLQMTLEQKLGASLFISAAMAVQDNAFSLSGVCYLQQQSRSPADTKKNIVMPLIEIYRESNTQQIANLSLALNALPQSLLKRANLVMISATNAAAIIEKGCQ